MQIIQQAVIFPLTKRKGIELRWINISSNKYSIPVGQPYAIACHCTRCHTYHKHFLFQLNNLCRGTTKPTVIISTYWQYRSLRITPPSPLLVWPFPISHWYWLPHVVISGIGHIRLSEYTSLLPRLRQVVLLMLLQFNNLTWAC